MLYGYREDETGPHLLSRMAVAILLPDDLNTVVARLREKYDPDYAIVAPHISVVAPFETDKPLSEIAEMVASIIQSKQEMEIEFDSVQDYYPDCPQICWGIKPNETLTRLYIELHNALDIPVPYKGFRPHLTLAREISEHRLMIVKEQLAPYLPEEAVAVEEIDLLAPVTHNNWVSIRTFFLSEPE